MKTTKQPQISYYWEQIYKIAKSDAMKKKLEMQLH